MARTVIDLDDDALARAAKVLGTKTKVDTVNRALNKVAPQPDQHEASKDFREFTRFIGERLSEVDWEEAWR